LVIQSDPLIGMISSAPCLKRDATNSASPAHGEQADAMVVPSTPSRAPWTPKVIRVLAGELVEMADESEVMPRARLVRPRSARPRTSRDT
jgi:hypothetical protein